MRQIVISMAAAAALMTSGLAQARPNDQRPGDRPSDYSRGGGGAGSVVSANNPYHNVEASGIARAQARVQKATHFGASRPAENGVRDGASAKSHEIARGGGSGGMSGGVMTGLNPYHYVEAGAIGRASARLQAKNGGQGPSMPGDQDGTRGDTASKEMKSMTAGGSRGMANSVRMGLNPFYYVEAVALARGNERVLKATNQGASQPPAGDGSGKDFASKEMKALTAGGASRPAGSIVGGLNPYDKLEKQAAGAVAGMKGLSGTTLRVDAPVQSTSAATRAPEARPQRNLSRLSD